MKITEEKLKKLLMQEAKKVLYVNRPEDYWTDDGYRGPKLTWTDDGPRDLEPRAHYPNKVDSPKNTPEYEYEDEPVGTDRFGLLSAEGDPDGDFDYENDRWRDPPKVKKPLPKAQKPVWLK